MASQSTEYLFRTNMDALQSPREFEFPFTPYEIQKDFMKNLYQVIEERKIGVFESPTGTGKSMSIICGVLTWLRDNDVRIKEHLEKVLTTSLEENPSQKHTLSVDDEPLWVSEFVQKKSLTEEIKQAKEQLERIKIHKNKIQRIRKGIERVSTEEANKKWMKYAKRKALSEEDETTRILKRAKLLIADDLCSSGMDDGDRDILLEEYFSEDEDIKITKGNDQKRSENHALQKVYYCSRTHSQLTQFIKEIQKSPFVHNTSNSSEEFFLSVVPLASRHSMCINESVRRLPSIQQVNDRCLEMQKSVRKTDVDKEEEEILKTKSKKKSSSNVCPYYKAQRKIEDLSDVILGKVQDIEDIVSAGKELEGCPYYAARRALPSAQLIVLPYQTLLYGPAREASGIDLKDAIVIVDEAHNLVDTLSNIHSVQEINLLYHIEEEYGLFVSTVVPFVVSCGQVAKAHNQLEQYVSKFSRKLKAKNLMYVKQILFILKNLLCVMGERDQEKLTSTKQSKCSSTEVKTTLMTIHNFLFKSKLDNINLYKVLRYCQQSQISIKLNGFVEKYEPAGESLPKESSALTKFLKSVKKDQENKDTKEKESPPLIMRSPLMHIESFLASLTSANEDGRVAVTVAGPDECEKMKDLSSIKFLLLNVAEHFKQVLNECRSLVVAGGTMQPSSTFLNELILPSGIPAARVHKFSCGHVISADQLLPIVLSSGPSGMEFEFTFEKRKNIKLIDELGRTLCNLCNIIPGGIVCFFPSYDYERAVYQQWENNGLLSRICIKKKIFREPKKANQVDSILSQYSSCIEKSKHGKSTITGSLLLSVVGGKMSEGINFSDNLGRCIVMVGLPYPNLYSAELKEKMAYLDAHMPHVGVKSAGQIYYENLCMKAVNQSIGRAIRHRNDHACIVLVDHRYKKSNIVSQLPGWIADKLQVTEKFGPTFSQIRKFFFAKKNEKS